MIGTGVLIGGYLPNHVLGVYAAPTPVEADEEAEAEDVAPKAELDIGWMMEHCKQVLRLLPGILLINFIQII